MTRLLLDVFFFAVGIAAYTALAGYIGYRLGCKDTHERTGGPKDSNHW